MRAMNTIAVTIAIASQPATCSLVSKPVCIPSLANVNGSFIEPFTHHLSIASPSPDKADSKSDWRLFYTNGQEYLFCDHTRLAGIAFSTHMGYAMYGYSHPPVSG